MKEKENKTIEELYGDLGKTMGKFYAKKQEINSRYIKKVLSILKSPDKESDPPRGRK